MKIAFFTENSYAGGLDTFLTTLINHWPRADDEMILICNQGHPGLKVVETRLRRPCQIIAHEIPLQWEWMQKFDKLHLPEFLKKAISALSSYPFFLFYLIAVKRLLGHVAPDRLMVVNGGYPAGGTCRAASIVWPAVSHGERLSVHNFHNFAVPPRWWERWVENAIDVRLAAASRALVTVSNVCAKSMAVRPAVPAHKVSHIPNGIPEPEDDRTPNRSETRRSLGVPSDAPLCLMMGTYEPRKGHAFLLETFRKVVDAVPAARLLICGYGYEEDVRRVRKIVVNQRLGDTVLVEGFRDDIHALLNAADVLLVPSQAFESFGLTLVEAMAHKVPFVATRVGGLPEVAGVEEGGFIVDRNDVNGFANRTIALLTNEPLRKEKGEKGYRRFRDRFRAEPMAAAYADLIKTEHLKASSS